MNLTRPVFYLLFLWLFFPFTTFGQHSYTFNKMMEFEYQDSPGSKVTADFFLMDTLKGGYKMQLFESSEPDKWLIIFKDFKGSAFRTKLSKATFSKVEKVNADCEGVVKTQRLEKIKDQKRIKDSIIDGVVCSQFDYTLKVRRNGSKVKAHYSVWVETKRKTGDNPLFVNFGENKDRDIPAGLVRYTYCRYNDDPHKYRIVRYKGSSIVNKTVVIPADCDYAK
ncbi:hypothetical protein [Flavobacterium silvaticum]|uniref:DUF4412 domain-containing protein n=1 Tax=Flavobacterium silvaticum TaxID=1852020 RepID=A0A972JGQ2_9FLAO|nr:hypothetical protein [Flavobacterium silvaticum]NMH29279.1 hypothetical protein [Flavobacterium silvaticum]